MIKHDGIVIAVNANGTVRVKIVQTSACAACKAKAMCASAESKEKEIEAIGDGLLAVGDTAEVLVQQKLGWKAVLLAYILPFVVMLGVVVIGNGLQVIGEEIVGTIALCAMGVYYIVLGFFKDKIQKEFSFTAVKKQ
ncbi:MAG: SoxR reducing system RseC family protein [Paludibacteraceae bacterium]|nr:SoxR reducing system RseC family protein [Paludibacteraceae bacterium]